MLKQESYLIIDIGTGNVRVAVSNIKGEIISIERDNVYYEKDKNYPDALSFNPDELWHQIMVLAKKVLQQSPGIYIKAITASSQREGIVLLESGGASLIGFPNHDHRGREWENVITAEEKNQVYKLTGRYPASLFSALKIIGFKKRYPELFQKVDKILSISDWAQYKLSGIAGYEHSQASETLLYDIEQKNWSEKLCSLFDINKNILPPLKSSGTILNNILPEQAAQLNIPAGAVIVAGGADTQLAIKSTEPGEDDIVIVSGTTTPVTKIVSNYIIDKKQRTWTGRHIEENEFILEANAGVTGLNYQRLKEIFYPNENYEMIEKELAETNNFECMASLGSLVADEKNSLLKGGFIFDAPVSYQLTRANFVWATLWDIACCVKENYNTLCNVSASDKEYVWACGGGFQSRMLKQLIADLLNKKVQIRQSYRQASVAGGALVCNKALGEKENILSETEIVHPQNNKDMIGLFEKWKKTREAFKSMDGK